MPGTPAGQVEVEEHAARKNAIREWRRRRTPSDSGRRVRRRADGRHVGDVGAGQRRAEAGVEEPEVHAADAVPVALRKRRASRASREVRREKMLRRTSSQMSGPALTFFAYSSPSPSLLPSSCLDLPCFLFIVWSLVPRAQSCHLC